MNHLVPIAASPNLPAPIAPSGAPAPLGFQEFFAAFVSSLHAHRANGCAG
jgi:hypothetical protein